MRSLETHDHVHRVLLPSGELAPGTSAPLSDEQCLEALRWMLLSRAVDERAFALHRQGKFGTYAPGWGQEASAVGSSMALDPGIDWIVPQYRETAAHLRHGYPLRTLFLYFIGHPDGAYIPEGVNMLPIQISIAGQLPHATGIAWGLKIQGKPGVVLTYVGDGGASEGDFHEACNLAGVQRAPVIFLVQDNGWAISVPRNKQSAATSLAARAEGYGFGGVTVDGNDLFAVYEATREAVERARSGGGPSLIETLTYRMWPHTTSDNPQRYQLEGEAEAHAAADPIARLVKYLKASDSTVADIDREVRAFVDAECDAAFEHPAPVAQDLFAHPYAGLDPRLERQRAEAHGEPPKALGDAGVVWGDNA